MHEAHKLTPMQIEEIINKLVPMIAAPEDQGFFRGVLQIKAENCSSGQFAHFVSQMLKSAK